MTRKAMELRREETRLGVGEKIEREKRRKKRKRAPPPITT